MDNKQGIGGFRGFEDFMNFCDSIGKRFSKWLEDGNFAAIGLFLVNVTKVRPDLDFTPLVKLAEMKLTERMPEDTTMDILRPLQDWLEYITKPTAKEEKQETGEPKTKTEPSGSHDEFVNSVYDSIESLKTALEKTTDPDERRRIENSLQDEYDSLK